MARRKKTVRGNLEEMKRKFEEKALETKAIRESIEEKIKKEGLNPPEEKYLVKLGEEITRSMQTNPQKAKELEELFNKVVEIRKQAKAKQNRLELKEPQQIAEETLKELERIENDFQINLVKNKVPVKQAEKLALFLLKKQSALTKQEQEKWNKEAMKELAKMMREKA